MSLLRAFYEGISFAYALPLLRGDFPFKVATFGMEVASFGSELATLSFQLVTDL
jgi:hypothetical protein